MTALTQTVSWDGDPLCSCRASTLESSSGWEPWLHHAANTPEMFWLAQNRNDSAI